MPARLPALLMLAALLAPAPARAGEAGSEDLFVRGLYREVFRGDLEGAAAAYRKVLAVPSATASLRSRARLRLGLCMERSGRADEAGRLVAEVLADSAAPESVRTRANLLRRRLDAMEKTDTILRQIRHLTEENRKLRKEMGRLQETLGEVRSRGDEQSRAERRRLLAEIESLRRKIETSTRDRDRLRRKVEKLAGGDREAPPEADERERAHEILRKLEAEKEIRQEEREFLADRFYANGVRFTDRGEYDRALQNFRECLRIWPDHPKARQQLLLVESLLGRPTSARPDEQESLRDIERQVWEAQKRIEVSNAFKEGLEFFTIRVFDRAVERFQRVVEIVRATFPDDPELRRQSRTAERYIALARNEGASPRSEEERKSAPVVTHVRLLSLTSGRLSGLFGKLHVDFTDARPLAGTRSYAVWAALDPVQTDLFLGEALSAADARGVGKASFILSSGVEERFDRFVDVPFRAPPSGSPGDPGGGLRLRDVRCGIGVRLYPVFEKQRGTVTLDLQVTNVVPGPTPLLLHGRKGALHVPIIFNQTFGLEAEVARRGSLIVLGLVDPFAGRDPAAPSPENRSRSLLLLVELVSSK